MTVLQPFLVVTWSQCSKEQCHTIVDQPTKDQSILWLPTPVILATLSMERAPGLVRVMKLGVGQLQLVKVGSGKINVLRITVHSQLSPVGPLPLYPMDLSAPVTGTKFGSTAVTVDTHSLDQTP